MTNSQIKQALLDECPVRLHDRRTGAVTIYKRVSAVIYRSFERRIGVLAELTDYNSRGLVVVDIDCLSRIEEDDPDYPE